MTLFTSQSTAVFYDRLFSTLDYKLPRAVTGRKGFPKEAMLCAFLVMKCEGFSQISDLVDYLENNRLIAYYCGFNIMKPLPSYWTYARFLRQVNNSELKEIMAALVRKLYDEGIVDASLYRTGFHHRSPPTPDTIIRSHLQRTSFQRRILRNVTATVRWAFIPLQISIMNADTSFTGAIRVTS